MFEVSRQKSGRCGVCERSEVRRGHPPWRRYYLDPNKRNCNDGFCSGAGRCICRNPCQTAKCGGRLESRTRWRRCGGVDDMRVQGAQYAQHIRGKPVTGQDEIG